MPLNKLENFIKNTEGRILYVNPNDLDATDSITNEGNSLTKPFKTIQRALLESARFTYRRGINNDKNDQTTILVFPGEHVIDNRPGWGIVNQSGAKAWRPSDGNASQAASDVFDLNLESNFDLTQEDNILYKFNSVYGGTIIPRGTSLVGLDLRKTKIRPKYVPNPTDSVAKRTAIFRITGNCYFWQFSIFDADESGVVYTNPIDFTDTAKPTFSHHKLTCFEYVDGVNIPKNISSLFAITDLDMYYAKLSNAYNTGSDNKNIDQKWPSEPLGFAKERPEWEIVGAFATDPLTISSIYSGDGSTSSSIVTVQTTNDHNLTVDTPIKINGVGIVGQLTANYNVSTKVQTVQSANTFTYVIPYIDRLTPADPTFSGATVTVETDTVKGGSPYIFNISLRSVWGMNGMLADGSKASGFRSMVVAQFTGVSLQKDDRAFVKYDVSSRNYDAIDISKVTGPELSTQSSSINVNKVYHLDSGAIYRSGWESSHIKAINDSFIQIVSVFAIGFNKHFDSESGGDLSITNSNSNFGQISLSADGFKVDAFDKDDHAYVTSIITPRAIVSSERNIDWFAIDVGVTTQVGISSHLYIFGFDGVDQVPPIITQGYRVGARTNDKLYVNFEAIAGYGVSEASIYMLDNVIETGIKTALGTTSAVKELSITTAPTTSNTFTFTTSGNHNLNTGEKVKIVSEVGDISEGLIDHQTYYIIKISANQFQLASSLTNAKNGSYIRCYLGEQLLVRSRVSEKYPGEVGSPVQFDTEKNKWFVHVNANNQIYNTLSTLGVSGIGADNTQTSFIKRIEDTRSLDEKIYKVRVVIPKEAVNTKNPEDAFIIQESNATNISPSPLNSEFNLDVITSTDYDWDRNPRFISGISTSGSIVTVISELPHNLKQGNIVKITNVVSSENASATDNIGYNGSFLITEIVDDKTFKHSTTDIFELSHLGTFGTFQNNTANRTTSLPRFQRVDLKTNYYIYRNEVISQHIQDVQDGIYHLYLLKADRQVTEEFTNLKHSQNVVNLYPELDRDNVNDSPTSAYSYSKRNPIGDVVTNDLKRSLTKEAIDTFVDDFGFGMQINAVTRDNVSGIATLTFARPHNLSGIVSCTISNAGTTYTGVGTYHNVKIFSNSSRTTWNGATARVTVSSGATISGVSVITGGSGYSAGTYYLDDVLLGKGAGTQATISVASNQLSSQVGNVVQVTGIGSISDSYYRITGVGATNKIAIALTSGDPLIASGQYAFQIGPSISINSALSSYNSTTGISTITCTSAHGLVSGNKFRIVSIGNTNLGDYVVSERVGVNTFTTKTNANLPLTSGRVLKHGFSANDAISDSSGENLGTRAVTFFDNEIATLEESIVGVSTFIISTSGISTSSRFSIGDYIQIDDEIMRVSKSSLTGLNELSVIRGYFGSNKSNHDKGSLIRKIKVLPIEFRRPSVIRASGHTFEYLGFGPGNYSTGLPQIQDRTLTEREDFLGQSQERSCGSVVYTGMNNRGDFYIGNKKVTSATGEEKTFDAPVPTVTGEDPSRLSAVFDEVTIKERLKVEGGKSKTILSQFDGPVTFTNNVKVTNADLEIIDGKLIVSDITQSTSKDSGAFIVEGGVGIEKNVYIGQNLNVNGTLTCSTVNFGNIKLAQTDDNTIDTSSGNLSLGAIAGSRVAITTNTTITGILSVTDDITAFWTSDQRLKDNITPIDDPLTKVLSISGNTFNWNEKSNKSGHDVGVIAQEVLEVLPEAVITRDNGYLAVDYHKVVPLLVEAIKELSAKVENLEQKLSDK